MARDLTQETWTEDRRFVKPGDKIRLVGPEENRFALDFGGTDTSIEERDEVARLVSHAPMLLAALRELREAERHDDDMAVNGGIKESDASAARVKAAKRAADAVLAKFEESE